MSEPRYNLRTLTGEENIDAQEAAGDPAALSYSTRVSYAVYWVLRRRDEPSFTYAAALKLPMVQINEEVVAGDDPPEVPGASNGAPPRSSADSGASVPAT
jgi:hypothetical protein